MENIESWGRVCKGNYNISHPAFIDAARDEILKKENTIPFGRGLSYGDVCLNKQGRLIATSFLDRIVCADWEKGIIRAEAGLTFGEILQVSVPRGWFLPVSPGTKFISLGGAIANDVHGKNHETAGTLGCHVRKIGLARSTGELLELTTNEELFTATIGGLGLTGLVLWVELQLKPIKSAYFDTETFSLANLDAFFRRAEESEDWEYSAAWINCLAKGKNLGSGVFTRGRHAETGGFEVHRNSRWNIPVDMPSGFLNSYSIGAFNTLYANRFWAHGRKKVHYDSLLYPLDGIRRWNKLYGKPGFFQHQCAIPMPKAPSAIRKLLELTSKYRQGSFLAVLKIFGKIKSPGMMSFPIAGATLALDFPNKGEPTLDLLRKLSDIAIEAEGRIYPAKDATMSAEHFQTSYPEWRKLEKLRDPNFMSDFWHRVTTTL